MGRLTTEEVTEELKKKKLTLCSEYKNLNDTIEVKCHKGHLIYTNLKTIRTDSFVCPACIGDATKNFDQNIKEPPKKEGYRIVAFDNSSHRVGISIYDDSKLVYYTVIVFDTGSGIERILDIRNWLENEVFTKWQPDFVQLEDIQKQPNYNTYEILAKALGVFEMACVKFGVQYSKDRASVWRGHFNINKKDRNLAKKLAIQYVKNMYSIDVDNDVAEAILIGKYRSNMISKNKLKDLF